MVALLNAGWSPISIILLYIGSLLAFTGISFLWLSITYLVLKHRGEVS